MVERTRLFRAAQLTLVAFFLAWNARAGVLDGELDARFWGDGKAILDEPLGLWETINDVVVAPDGKLIAVGRQAFSTLGAPIFWGVLTNSALEPVCLEFNPEDGAEPWPTKAYFDDQGRLIIIGSAQFPTAGREGFVLRYLYPECELDPTFNLNGIFRTNLSDRGVGPRAAAFDSQGRLVVVGWSGYADDPEEGNNPFAFRLTPGGLLDWSFASFGHFELTGPEFCIANGVVIQDEDRVVIVGGCGELVDYGLVLAIRLDSGGELDQSFAGDGIGTYESSWDDWGTEVMLEPVTGRILIGGVSTIVIESKNIVLRLDPNGELDETFGVDGYWKDPDVDGNGVAALERQSDGRMLVVGTWSDGHGDERFEVYAVTPDGLPDTAFGVGGRAEVDFAAGDNHQVSTGATIHGGKLVVAGLARLDDRDTAVAARLWIPVILADDFEGGDASGWSSVTP